MLVLASASPRRREILERAGIPFVIRPASVDETLLGGESAEAYVKRLARAKAEAVDAAPGDLVLGADTVVVVDDQILGKPADPADAALMLTLLNGRWHEVLTGICLRSDQETIVEAVSTRVHFTPLTGGDIDGYVASGEPMDKAGAYAIQGLASKFIDGIEGCYFNVVGLPVATVFRHYRRLSR